MVIDKKLIYYRLDNYWRDDLSDWNLQNRTDFIHKDAEDCFKSFKALSESDTLDIKKEEERFRNAMQNGINPSDFFENISANEPFYDFWNKLYLLIAYLDHKGYRSPRWENEINSAAGTGVYQHYWIYNLLAYIKASNDIEAINSQNIQRAIKYIEAPNKYCTILSEWQRVLIAEHIFGSKTAENFENQMRNFFENGDYPKIFFKEEKNRMVAYSWFFYENRDLWQKLNRLNYSINSIQIKNIGGIKNIELTGLSPENRWIFLTGENGFGKSSILQAITLGLRGVESFTFNLAKQNPNRQIEISLNDKENPVKSSIDEPIKDKILAYGSSRLSLMKKDHAKTPESPVQSLFENNIGLQNIEEKFADWHIKRDENAALRIKYEQVQETFSTLLPYLQIVPNEEDNEISYIETIKSDQEGEDKNYTPVQYQQLASGYKTILAMVGDMLINLYDSQKDVLLTSELRGIVIIDEIELHLHPKLQKELPTLLSSVFPKVQFIVSTHSPIPLLGAPEHSVFLKVNRTKEEGITVERMEGLEEEIQNLLPNLILSSPMFGLTNIYPKTHTSKSGRIRTEDTYQDKEFNDEVKARLDKYLESKENQEKLKNLFKR